jgi:hypothetical protein
LHLPVQSSRVRENAIKRPIDRNIRFVGVAQHSHKPILHGTAVQMLDNVKDFCDDLELEFAKPGSFAAST